MPAESANRSVSRTVFRWLVVVLVFFAAAWFAVIAWWDMTEHMASTFDVLLYMIVLPLGMLALLALLRRAFFPRKAPAQPASAQSDTAPGDAPVEPLAASDARAPDLPILAAWASTWIGTNGGEFVDTLAQRRERPVPDQLLLDGDGFPPLTGRVQDLDTDRVCSALRSPQPARMHGNESDMDEGCDALLRALALLETVLQQAAQEWPFAAVDTQAGASTADSLATLRGASGLPSEYDAPLELHVKLLVSAALSPSEIQAAQIYAEQSLTALGMCASRRPVDIIPTADDATALKLIEGFRLDAQDADHKRLPQALLLLACDSALCQTTVDAWVEQGRLFAPHRPNGLMPGEAAFAILCANETALQAATARPLCYLGRSACAQRSTDVGRKQTHECLTGVIRAALSACGAAGDAIGTVVCDADHRTSVTLESIEAMLSEIPALDAIENRLAVNEFCGHLGAASVPGVLAAAALRAHAAGHPVLAFNASHACERAAAVLLPSEDEEERAQPQALESA